MKASRLIPAPTTARVFVLAAVLACGCAPDPSRQISLAGQWPCRIERVDGSASLVDRYAVPVALFRDVPGSAQARAVDCRLTIPGAFLATLERPALMLGFLGRQRGGTLAAWLDDARLPESDRTVGTPVPVPIGRWADATRDAVVRVRYERSGTGPVFLGEPPLWAAGEQRALFAQLMWRSVPSLTVAVVLGLIGMAALVAAVVFRRVDRQDAIAFGLLATFCLCMTLAQLNDNPLLAALGTRDFDLLYWLRGPTGLLIVASLIELLRRHLGVRLRWWLVALHISIAASIVVRLFVFLGWMATSWFNWTNVPAILMLPALVAFAWLAWRDRRAGNRVIAVALSQFIVIILCRLLSFTGLYRLPDLLVYGLYGMTLGVIVATLQASGQRRLRLRRAELLGRFLPSPLVRRVLDGVPMPREERRRLTVFFSDLRGFTRLSDRLEPEVLVKVLSEYLTTMVEIAERHGGTIDKFIGDAVMVFFGAPEPMDDQAAAIACVSMAIEMQRAMPPMNARWPKEGLDEPLTVRMGINTGYATVGEFGSLQRSDYTAIGSSVNLAQRLESACPPGGTLISQATHALVHESFVCQTLEPIHPKGYDRTVPVWLVDPRQVTRDKG